MKTQILIICVNYNSTEDTAQFVRNLIDLDSSNQMEVLIANNSAKDESDSSFNFLVTDRLKVLNIPQNKGYFGAAQAALEYYSTQKQLPPFVIVSNVDLEISDKDFVNKVTTLKFDAKTAVIAPAIISLLSKRNSNPYLSHRPTNTRMHFYKWVFAHWLTCQAYQLLGLTKAKLKSLFSRNPAALRAGVLIDQKSSPIYAAHGSFMIFTSNYFQNGGNFKHGAFLYGEEVTVAEFCLKHDLKTIYEPNIQIYHREHGSTGMVYSRKTLSFIKESSKYLADTYF